jgi:hypothetical protein
LHLSKIKGKGKAVPLHAMKALGGRGDITPTITYIDENKVGKRILYLRKYR